MTYKWVTVTGFTTPIGGVTIQLLTSRGPPCINLRYYWEGRTTEVKTAKMVWCAYILGKQWPLRYTVLGLEPLLSFIYGLWLMVMFYEQNISLSYVPVVKNQELVFFAEQPCEHSDLGGVEGAMVQRFPWILGASLGLPNPSWCGFLKHIPAWLDL